MSTDPLTRLLAHAIERPGHPAVVENNRVVTYQEFTSLVRRMAAAICQKGERILIALPQCVEAYAAMFAALMAGAFYSTINLTVPLVRQRMVINGFNPNVIIGAKKYLAGLLTLDDKVQVLDVENLPYGEMRGEAPPHDLAYVMFTSGSTGEPKGVMIPRQGLEHYVLWATDAMGITPEDRMSQHPNIAFDLSVLDIYGALCSGATLYPLGSRVHRIAPGGAIQSYRLTIWNSVPSVIDLMNRGKQITPACLDSLRLMTFCGEPLLHNHLDSIFHARPDIVVHNTYGPTEATVSCTMLKLNSETFREACSLNCAIGDPIPGMNYFFVDGNSTKEGEIVLSGPQLARGYWNDPERTAGSFQSLKINGREHSVYRTGDWGKRVGDHVYWVTRMDRQVKIHGYRVELGDIDAMVRSCGVNGVFSIFMNNTIVCFIERQDSLDVEELRKKLTDLLPNYQVPDLFKIVDQFPLNSNGKIDSAKLKETVNNGETLWLN